jgi:hypothetical protein
MMTPKFILNKIPAEWLQQYSSEEVQKHQVSEYIAVQGDDFERDRNYKCAI